MTTPAVQDPPELENKDGDLQAIEYFSNAYAALKAELAKVIVGQEQVIDELLIAIFTRSHALLVGVPGLAKTLLISTLAQALQLSFKRIQFTPDLMPSDITGTEVIYQDPATNERQFKFLPRPDFCQRHPRRRNQPHPAENAGGDAGGDAGAARDGGRDNLQAARSRSSCSPRRTRWNRRAPIPLPEAQLDRFMFMIQVDYPSRRGDCR